jgi:hypothetical protein
VTFPVIPYPDYYATRKPFFSIQRLGNHPPADRGLPRRHHAADRLPGRRLPVYAEWAPIETALALCGVAIAGYLLKEGKRRWNFTEIEAAGDYHLNLAYESDRNYQELLEVLARVRPDGWENLNLEDKVRIRHRVEALVEKEPLPRDYLATADTVENLRVISKTGGQRPNSIKR